MTSLAPSFTRRLSWTREDLFGDLRVRHGIKLGLAGLLAVFWAQVLRLPYDNWAVIAQLFVMNGQFVGALDFNALIWFVSTAAGAVLGVWLVSDYTNTPEIFLPIFFLVMAFASYKYGQVGARQRPFAYFLLGLTMVPVATIGVTDPVHAWQLGLSRTEEILVGVICALFVSTLVWPRYGREEFLDAGRAALKTVTQLVSIHTLTYIGRADAPFEIDQIHRTFEQQFSRLTSLLQAGVHESPVFSARLANYNAFMVSLNSLFHAGLALDRHRGAAGFLEHLQSEIESLCAAISDEFGILTATDSGGGKLQCSLINEKFAAFEAKVNQIRAQGMLLTAPLQTAMDLAGEFAVLRALRDGLNNMRSAIEGLPRFGQPVREEKPHWEFFPTIDWFWVKVGIKGGLSAVIAIVFVMWIHPPGAANAPLWAWLFVVWKKAFFRVSGASDLRVFQTALRGSLILAGLIVLLPLITPILASYAAMNLVLFLVLFATGFFTAKISGLNFWSAFTFLTITIFVALNPQVPVPSQTIIDSFIGPMFGLLIATFVSRLIWPLLPQRILRDSLLALFGRIEALLGEDPNREKVLTHLTNLAVEALGAIPQIQIAGCSEEERTKLIVLVRRLQTLTDRVGQLVFCREVLPEITERIMRPQLQRLEIEFKQMLGAFAECFRQGDCRRELPVLAGALTEMDHAVQKIRDRNLLGDLPPEAALRALDLVDRYHATADALDECGQLIRSLRIERYWGDYGL